MALSSTLRMAPVVQLMVIPTAAPVVQPTTGHAALDLVSVAQERFIVARDASQGVRALRYYH